MVTFKIILNLKIKKKEKERKHIERVNNTYPMLTVVRKIVS